MDDDDIEECAKSPVGQNPHSLLANCKRLPLKTTPMTSSEEATTASAHVLNVCEEISTSKNNATIPNKSEVWRFQNVQRNEKFQERAALQAIQALVKLTNEYSRLVGNSLGVKANDLLLRSLTKEARQAVWQFAEHLEEAFASSSSLCVISPQRNADATHCPSTTERPLLYDTVNAASKVTENAQTPKWIRNTAFAAAVSSFAPPPHTMYNKEGYAKTIKTPSPIGETKLLNSLNTLFSEASEDETVAKTVVRNKCLLKEADSNCVFRNSSDVFSVSSDDSVEREMDTQSSWDIEGSIDAVDASSTHNMGVGTASPLAFLVDPQAQKLHQFSLYIDNNSSQRLYSEVTLDSRKEFDLWNSKTFCFSNTLKELNWKIFGHRSFRGVQLAAINALLSGEDCFVIMPTGGGKSLCYQLPSVILDGVVLVVSPLLALMHNQIANMNHLGISAVKLASDTSNREFFEILDSLKSSKPNIRVLLVTPERLSKSNSLIDLLTSLYERQLLKLVVVDECIERLDLIMCNGILFAYNNDNQRLWFVCTDIQAHCVSQWGLDFRSDYRQLSKLKLLFPDIPLLALTASAPPKIISDVKKVLNIQNCVLLKCSVNRPNIWLEVRSKSSNIIKEIVNLLSTPLLKDQCGVIYCLSVQECMKLAETLRKTYGYSACEYHAKLANTRRQKVLNDWLSGSVQVIVATVAFGLGIDKPDVRFVFHYSVPQSVDRYYQEIGRAGRDGRCSRAVLWYSLEDVERLKKLVRGNRHRMDEIQEMLKYCTETVECRRKLILRQFGEHSQNNRCNDGCDNCTRNPEEAAKALQVMKDMSESGIKLVQLVKAHLKGRKKSFITKKLLRDASRGSSNKMIVKYRLDQIAQHGCLKGLSNEAVDSVIKDLIREKYLQEEYIKGKERFSGRFVVRPSPASVHLCNGSQKLWVPFNIVESTSPPSAAAASNAAVLSPYSDTRTYQTTATSRLNPNARTTPSSASSLCLSVGKMHVAKANQNGVERPVKRTKVLHSSPVNKNTEPSFLAHSSNTYPATISNENIRYDTTTSADTTTNNNADTHIPSQHQIQAATKTSSPADYTADISDVEMFFSNPHTSPHFSTPGAAAVLGNVKGSSAHFLQPSSSHLNMPHFSGFPLSSTMVPLAPSTGNGEDLYTFPLLQKDNIAFSSKVSSDLERIDLETAAHRALNFSMPQQRPTATQQNDVHLPPIRTKPCIFSKAAVGAAIQNNLRAKTKLPAHLISL